MQCPRCGGWHYGDDIPPVNYRPSAIDDDKSREILFAATKHVLDMLGDDKDPYDRDVRQNGNRVWESRVYGVDESGDTVTASFGRKGASTEGATMISSGFRPEVQFYDRDEHGKKLHDHSGQGFYVDRNRHKDTSSPEWWIS